MTHVDTFVRILFVILQISVPFWIKYRCRYMLRFDFRVKGALGDSSLCASNREDRYLTAGDRPIDAGEALPSEPGLRCIIYPRNCPLRNDDRRGSRSLPVNPGREPVAGYCRSH